jgi:2'-5' RNA ligase
MSYHLWLMPSGAAKDRLARTIAGLAQSYDAPRFEPHVTLLGNLPGTEADILSSASNLARDLQCFEIQPRTPGFTDRYFQCLFLHVEPTPSLLAAHITTRTVFSREDDTPYIPHISLMYGSYPVRVKQEIIATLPEHLLEPFSVDRLYLIRADSDDPKEWHRLREFPFAS